MTEAAGVNCKRCGRTQWTKFNVCKVCESELVKVISGESIVIDKLAAARELVELYEVAGS